jgi:hypothetical protein
MKIAFRTILVIAVIVIAVMVFRSIMRPEKYRMIYEARKTEIRDRLVALRAAQTIYKSEHKIYAGNIDSLVNFIQNGQVLVVKNVGDIPEGMSETEAFNKGLLQKQTISLPAKSKVLEIAPDVADKLSEFQFIPYNKGKKFDIQLDSLPSKTYKISVYRIDVPVEDILANMNESILPPDANLFKKALNYVLYHNLSEEKYAYDPMYLGSLSEASTAGSWE